MLKVGDILIAEPFLGDDHFERSVILLGNYASEGAFGFVINKKSNLLLSDVSEEMKNFEVPLFIGGPVEQDTLHFIYRNVPPLEGATLLKDNLYWGGDFEQLKIMLRNNLITVNDIRFFLGYSGWSAGQLDEEMNKKSWISGTVSVEDIFDTDINELWRLVLKNMGGKYKVLANYPIDPRLN